MNKIRSIIGAIALGVAQACCAATPAEQLAVETYRYLDSSDGRLTAAINKGRRDQFDRFVIGSAEELSAKWPSPGDDSYDPFMRCKFALIAFRQYAEDQYKANGSLSPDFITVKDYFEQRRLCKKSLKGKH